MPLDQERLANWVFDEQVREYTRRDTMLYALGVGCGGRPEDLRFVYEDGLVALPSMATVLGDPGFWLRDPTLGADWRKIVHGEQSIVLHAPLPPEGAIVARNRVEAVIDRGPRHGVFVYLSRSIHDRNAGTPIASLGATVILRGDGKTETSARRPAQRSALPDRHPDIVVSSETLPQSALIYRLSGDLNPLHVDPTVAARAGFPSPILHGLCTMGVAARAILRACCDDDPGRLRDIHVRFTAPVFPGDTIVTEIWRQGSRADFRCRVRERGVVVLDASHATFSEQP
ncbi:MaoC/PaaZ C-terminal domain-containing protein [Aquamicrobium sp. LC103]|uniref:MaoC/PaaZ C-terminal domain-containing protein n=1 Tax=Aquamicrobium sp. LC103 TaxID=1120658 RepID=UPI00063EAE0D|nr:MaoC/PaaZ C-terminal domain-containing protein [Aquamicrobium sp. LC103]TKT78375.1 3-alpha,7-alpha,12-alpha-trihydroxy-5-beta-cholest-24-enoyl-CoA hydratase [Aquamicrobium sp. LC103]